jgi:nucleoside-diphosphate-sugar epimerase
VDDAIAATHQLAVTPAANQQIVHVGNPAEEITMQQLAELVLSLMNLPLPIEERGRRIGSVSRRCPDTAKLRQLTGFEAKIRLPEGVAGTIEWYLAHTQ